MAEDDERKVIRKDMDYHRTLLEGLFLSFKEAADDGLLAEYEDLIDALYASVPVEKKLDIEVFDQKREKKNNSTDEWDKAMDIKPPDGGPQSQQDRHPSNKRRALRKCQILCDIFYSLGFLMDEPPSERIDGEISRQVYGPDIVK